MDLPMKRIKEKVKKEMYLINLFGKNFIKIYSDSYDLSIHNYRVKKPLPPDRVGSTPL